MGSKGTEPENLAIGDEPGGGGSVGGPVHPPFVADQMRVESVIAAVLACVIAGLGVYALLKQASPILGAGAQVSSRSTIPGPARPELRSDMQSAAPANLAADVPTPMTSPVTRPNAAAPSPDPPPEVSREIFLCRDYGGGRFYSSIACSRGSALTERIIPSNPHLSFEDQVRAAEGAEVRRDSLAQARVAERQQYRQAVGDSSAECENLYNEVRRLDQLARQPNSPPYQDWLRGERRKATDRIFSLGC